MKIRLIALAALLAGAAAQAGTLQVTVTDKDGKPAPDVVVLVDSAQKSAPRPAAQPVAIAQENLRFVPFLTVVPAGSTVRFSNKDGYDHHVRSMPSGPLGSMPAVKNFELRLDAAQAAPADGADEYKTAAPPRGRKSGTASADVKLDQPGPIGLGCHLHASMRGQIYVSPTPWFAKTDANGVATIEGVPEGAADLSLWHPDQLAEQPAVRLSVGATPLQASGQLNFVPKRRRG